MKHFKSGLLLLLVMAVVIAPAVAFSEDFDEVGDYVSLAAPKGPNAEIAPGHYGLIGKYADSYFSSSSTITVPNQYRMLGVGSTLSQFSWIIDVRQPLKGTPTFCGKHFVGAINIPFQFIAKPLNLAQLPTNGEQILVVCYSGISSAEVAAFLNVIGYNAFFLQGGMSNSGNNQLPTTAGGDPCVCPAGTAWNGWECAE